MILVYRLLRLLVADFVGGTEGTYAGKIQKKVPQIKTIGHMQEKYRKKSQGLDSLGHIEKKIAVMSHTTLLVGHSNTEIFYKSYMICMAGHREQHFFYKYTSRRKRGIRALPITQHQNFKCKTLKF